ncbi:MAG TPA: YdeI/OmpD-associated family protein [Gillisia sp.]|nr:YdeI/OmpD-associated family protein [Gillisia sp.]
MQKIESVDQYIQSHPKWTEILLELRELLNSTVLTETIKWGGPVYTLDGKNLLGIGAFKNHSALWFFQGALLQENTNLLINAQEGKTKVLRQIRFEAVSKIDKQELLKYIDETISLHKQGKEIKPNLNKEILIPSKLSDFFKSNSELKKAFSILNPGKQREYAEYITEAKRNETKQKRIEKIIPMIKVGIGLNDKYKNC